MYCSTTRYIGLDYGDKTIGVSISSPSGQTAVGLTTLTRENPDHLRPSLQALKEIIKQHQATHIVLGYPLHLSGRESLRCTKTLDFKDKLNRYFKSIPVELWDERLSTQAVSRFFEGTKSQYKDNVDQMAAVYILQGFLDRAQNILKTQPTTMKERKKMEKEPNMDVNPEDATITLYDEDGDEIEMQILSSRILDDITYVMVVEAGDEDAEVMHFKLIDDGEEDTIFEFVDDEHEDFDRVFDLFQEDYKTLGIDVTDIEIEL